MELFIKLNKLFDDAKDLPFNYISTIINRGRHKIFHISNYDKLFTEEGAIMVGREIYVFLFHIMEIDKSIIMKVNLQFTSKDDDKTHHPFHSNTFIKIKMNTLKTD